MFFFCIFFYNQRMIIIETSSLSAHELSNLKLTLTFKLKEYNNPTGYKEVKFYEERGNTIRIPRFYAALHLSNINYADESLKSLVQQTGLRFNGKLQETKTRPQITAFHATVKQLQTTKGALLVLPPGTGKTNLAIAIALHLRLKVLVLVHTDFLLTQWQKRITDFVIGTNPVKIGLIQQDTCDSDGCDFVLASIQSLHSRDYDTKDLACGLLIVDEAHHIAANTFSQVLAKIPHYYSMGLTATPKRGDGLGPMIEYLLGSRCFELEVPRNKNVQVNMITYTLGQEKEIVYKNGTVGISSMVTLLTKDALRNKLLVDIISLLYMKFPTRKGLLLSDRVDHSKQIYHKLDPSMSAIITGNIHTEMTKKERAQRKKEKKEVEFTKFITLSTYKMFSEAVDFDGDFIILSTPKVNIEQSTGRILRGRNLKHDPVIFDIVDPFSSFDVWRWTRFNFYKKRGYEIVCLKEFQIYNEAKRTSQHQRNQNQSTTAMDTSR